MSAGSLIGFALAGFVVAWITSAGSGALVLGARLAAR